MDIFNDLPKDLQNIVDKFTGEKEHYDNVMKQLKHDHLFLLNEWENNKLIINVWDIKDEVMLELLFERGHSLYEHLYGNDEYDTIYMRNDD